MIDFVGGLLMLLFAVAAPFLIAAFGYATLAVTLAALLSCAIVLTAWSVGRT